MRRVTLFAGMRAARNPRARSIRLNLEILEDRVVPSGYANPGVELLTPGAVSPAGGAGQPAGFSPSQISQAYGFNGITFNNGSVRGDGSGQTIAIVDAYNQPNITSNLQTFDSTYGLPDPPNFTVVNQNGGSTLPAADQGWGLEISLDVEWAHAMAPGANILLVEANSNSYSDLLAAVNYARNQPNVSVVSMSWGGGEWSGETSYDNYFTTPSGHSGVTFVASTGDSGSAGAPEFPSVSPNILAVGGTQLTTDSAGNYLSETGWSGSGGGISTGELQPDYQRGVVTQTSTARAVPDVSYDGSSNSPFAVYDTSSYSGWLQVYGTSAGAPQWAALLAIANQGRELAGKGALDGGTQTLPALYQLPQSDFHDVTSGNNGGYSAGAGYDLVTGRGSPMADRIVAGLVSVGGAAANPPWVVTPASATPSAITGTTTNLSVRGDDASGVSSLIYTWYILSEPAAATAPTINVNGTNAAQNATITFHQAGAYTFQVVILDPSGLTVSSNVAVTVNQTLTSIFITPGSAKISQGGTLQFTATAQDQFGNAMSTQPNWTVSGAGTINSNGLYSAPSAGTGTALIQVSINGMTQSATVAFAAAPPSNLPSNPWAAWLNWINSWIAQLAFLQTQWQSLLSSRQG
jgi:subtilase family serine protease